MDWKSYLAALGSQLTFSHKPKPLPERRGNYQSLNEDIVLLIISLFPVVCEATERKREQFQDGCGWRSMSQPWWGFYSVWGGTNCSVSKRCLYTLDMNFLGKTKTVLPHLLSPILLSRAHASRPSVRAPYRVWRHYYFPPLSGFGWTCPYIPRETVQRRFWMLWVGNRQQSAGACWRKEEVGHSKIGRSFKIRYLFYIRHVLCIFIFNLVISYSVAQSPLQLVTFYMACYCFYIKRGS